MPIKRRINKTSVTDSGAAKNPETHKLVVVLSDPRDGTHVRLTLSPYFDGLFHVRKEVQHRLGHWLVDEDHYLATDMKAAVKFNDMFTRLTDYGFIQDSVDAT